MEAKASRSYKMFKTLSMNFAPIAMGIFLEIVGPTLPDLKRQLGVNYEEIARGLVARSVGYFISSASGGVLADTFPRHVGLMLSLALGLGAFGTGLVPLADQLWQLAFFFHLQGLAQGFMDTFNNSLCAMMWGKQATVPLHGLHLGFGIGAFIAPQLARPFISDPSKMDSTQPDSAMNLSIAINNATSGDGVTFDWMNQTVVPGNEIIDDQSHVGVPYFISCGISTFFAILFLMFYIYEQTNNITFHENVANQQNREVSIGLDDTQDSLPEYSSTDIAIKRKHRISILQKYAAICSPGSCTNGNRIFGVQFFSLIFLYYINIVGGERVYSKFIYSYAIDSEGGFNRDSATLVNSLFWIFFTLGRALAVVLSNFVSARHLIIFNLSCNVLSGIILSIWGYENAIVLYMASSVLGLTISPLIPNCMAWANVHVRLTGVAFALIFTGGACGGAIYQWLGGFFYEYYGPETMMYTMLVSSLFLSSVFCLLLLAVRKRRD